MHIRELNGKKVCILGFGKEGQATLRALEEHESTCEITIADRNEKLEIGNMKWEHVHWKLGEDFLSGLERFDVIIKSPGIPPCSQLKAHSSKLTSSTQIFLDTVAEEGATVIGITGSKGKSTTTSLIHAALLQEGRDAHLVGNIGIPALDFLNKASEEAIFVMEMSSYQLMDLQTSPHIAVVTSFFPEHLDYHGSLEAYLEAKKHITRFQTEEDIVIFNAESDGAKAIAAESDGTLIPVKASDAPIPLTETRLLGTHNLSNMALAWRTVKELGVSLIAAKDAFRAFSPLPHRLQNIGEYCGLTWIDDAISTTPESAIAALDALGDRVATVILGGQDRGNDFSPLAERLKKSSVKTVILLGESGKRIRKAIEESEATTEIYDAKNMEDAVAKAQYCTAHRSPLTANRPHGESISPIALLSPASPSYDLFKNFEEKGNLYQEAIKRLK